MINITLKDGKKIETKYCEKYSSLSRPFICYIDNETETWKCILWDDVAKVEKQMKDCSKEEIYKWAKMEYDIQLNKIVMYRTYIYVIVCIEGSDELETIHISDRDYIDITDLIKGE